MLKAALKNTCSVKNRLFPLRVLGGSWESHRILQTAHKHEICVLFSFLLICIHFWSCKTVCIWLTLFPINFTFLPISWSPTFYLNSFWLYFSFLPILLTALNHFLSSSVCHFLPAPLLQCGYRTCYQTGKEESRGNEPARIQAMRPVPVVKEVILALEQGLHASSNWPVDDSTKSSKWSEKSWFKAPCNC